jgi:hypothetical protein
MITLTNAIDNVCALAAQRLQFEKALVLGTAPKKFIMFLQISESTYPSAGAQLVLVWPQGNCTFYGGADFPFAPTSNLNYTQTIANALKNVLVLSQAFDIQYLWSDGYIQGYISMEARTAGTAFNLTVSSNTTPWVITSTAGANGGGIPLNERINIAVEVLTDEGYEPTVTEIPAVTVFGMVDEENNRATFTWEELPEMLRSLLPVIDLPLPWSDILFGMRTFGKVRLRINEVNDNGTYDGDGAGNADLGLPDPLIATRGAYLDMDTLETAGVVFVRSPYASNIIRQGQPFWLVFYLIEYRSIELSMTVTYTDLSSDVAYSAVVPLPEGSFLAPFGLVQGGGALPGMAAGKVPYSMDITLGVILVGLQTLTLYFDNRHAEYERYLVFVSDAGVPETMALLGRSDYESKFTRASGTRARTDTTDPDTGTIYMMSNTEQHIITLRTGMLMTQGRVDYMRSLLLSEYVAEIDMKLVSQMDPTMNYETPMRSIITITDSIKLYNEADGKWSLEWQAKYADDSSFFSENIQQLQVYNDTIIEMTITVSDLSSVGSQNVTFTANVPITATLNGQYCDPSGFYYDDTTVAYVISITANGINEFSVGTSGGDATINITRIRVSTLNSLVVIFSTIKCDYLLDRLPYMGSLVALYMIASDGYLPTDRLLLACNQIFNISGSLSAVTILGGIATPVGDAAANNLLANGLYVTY